MKIQYSIFVLILALCSCKKDKDKVDFDRGAMLSNISSNVILPSLSNTETEFNNLHSKVITFTSNPTEENLSSVRSGFVSAYKSFQSCKMYDFGPMADYGITASTNTYPTDTSKITSNINSGAYNLSSAENITAIGLPAIDFLLYGESTNQVIQNFTSHSLATNRKNYLINLSSKMKSEFSVMTDQWQTYISTFDAAEGNDIGSSTSIMFNAFVMDIELLKNAKIGIPAGFQTSGQTLPNYVEGYYAGISLDLALENCNALQNLFNGANGISFDDYIRDVESEDVSVSLAKKINDQFETIESKLTLIQNPLSEKVNSNPDAVNTAWNEIKKLVTYVKTDMSSILGLLITFQDNDGD